MTKRMLIDATHAEETRVVVLDGNRLEDFDVETSTKRQLKGNIYLAKVVRVEPSLQAAFVEYGGNRHGFLAFSEIHPDYYQIPVADRQRLLELQAEEARREEEEADLEIALSQGDAPPQPQARTAPARKRDARPDAVETDLTPEPWAPEPWALASTPPLLAPEPSQPEAAEPESLAPEPWAMASNPPLHATEPQEPEPQDFADGSEQPDENPEPWALPDRPQLLATAPADRLLAELPPDRMLADADPEAEDDDSDDDYDTAEDSPPPETVGGGDSENGDESRERRLTSRFMRNYKIQEVIRRRQILLVQVVKEERGTKGAALTTYLSLAGRFGVLMPNSPRGGGISRKITSAADRRRLKEVMAELDIPRGMGLIVRTAGANRPKPEIKRDFEYLLRLWDDIRDHTLKSVAPALIYEEASLIKRAIRDVYSRDIDEILVDGEEGWRAAHEFMRMLMPSHAKKVQLWREGLQPLFARQQVEAQLDAMLQPTVQLRSGGYLVINQTEALVAIDVNSGRSTRERNVEETALRTNLEAADEAARQLRLRDLAGLIVIDFIDMESKRHNAMVERRIKEALKNDRARIQVGHISHFGLLEMSRQRLRPSLAEASFILCPHCGGTGHVRSTENAAIHVLRGIEDEGGKRRAAEVIVHCATATALYLLNHKRERLSEIELRYHMRVIIAADESQTVSQFRVDRVRARAPEDFPVPVIPERAMIVPPPEPEVEEVIEEDAVIVAEDEADDEADDEARADTAARPGESAEDADRRRRRRRRRRRGGRREDGAESAEAGPDAEAGPGADEEPVADAPVIVPAEAVAETPEAAPPAEAGEGGETPGETDPRQRRRGRRGGRRRREDGEISPFAVPGAEQPELLPVYAGPTPADPFGGRAFDIFDVMDQVERQAEAAPLPRSAPGAEIVNAGAPEPVPETAAAEAQGELAMLAPPVVVEPVAAELVAEVAPAEPAAAVEATPEPVAEPVAVAAEIHNVSAPEPTPEHLPVATEPDAPMPANDVAPSAEPEEPTAPVIRPVLVGAEEEPPGEKKRGWWRR